MVKIEPFDTAHHLDNPEVISHYLAEALETGDHKLIVRAITNVLRASRIANIASATSLSRTSLYWKKNKASPKFTTVLKVLDAVGVRLEPIPARSGRKRRQPPPPSRTVHAGSRGRH